MNIFLFKNSIKINMRFLKNKKFISIIFFLMFFFISGFITGNNNYSMIENENNFHYASPNTINSNVLPDFWNITNIESVPLDSEFENQTYYIWNDTYSTISRNLTVYDVSYTSQVWNGSNLTIAGKVVFPDNKSGNIIGTVPGALIMHGIFGNYNSTLPLAYMISGIFNCVSIVIDFPGHGKSEGPFPSPDNIMPPPENITLDTNITQELLDQIHFYL